MLAVTTDAAQAIQGLVAGQPGAGLRISSQFSDSDHMQLGVAVSAEPSPTDQVVQEAGCQVFLDEEVAPLLDERTLDAHVNDEQQIAFTILP